MKKFVTNFGISILPSTSLILLSLLVVAVSKTSTGLVGAKKNFGTPMHSVQLTQKGYIQFLRWELPVPEIHEFTFCLWVKSSDLTHPHSILSYSRNERERLIRSWISSRGRSIHLEIGGVEVFQRPVRIREHRWYHICQSWENRIGRYALWLDGRLVSQGRSEEVTGHVIPEGGDIVLGQEYTDFNKGLEEGIEGSVLGFNLLLTSVFTSLDSGLHQRPSFWSTNGVIDPTEISHATGIRTRIARRDSDLGGTRAPDGLVSVLFKLGSNWSRRISRTDDVKAAEGSVTSQSPLNIINDTLTEEATSIRRHAITFGTDDWTEGIDPFNKSFDVSLGLQLVKLSYIRCQLGRGSPPIGGPLMLISWSRTPVKVFGGAIIKNVGNECGKF
ncbi:Pentraxin-related protein PTX3 [Cyphomyrmex costatus]|uniref:Pentraxin-related protein PTX3 n=1 Tax=Cyphomyrmex costatus TaxID=456900 RepID=A0A195CJ43_9HYME|nr:Pentraxin-related protein PTX3 [Cyphomyrmex costatus]